MPNPTITSYIVGDQKVTIFFVSDLSYNNNYKYSINNSGWNTFIPTGNNDNKSTRSLIITGLRNSKSYSIKIRTSNINNVYLETEDSINFIPSLLIQNSQITRTMTNTISDTTNESFELRMLTTTNNFSSKNHLSCLKKISSYQKELPRVDPFFILSGNPSIIFDNNYYYITFINDGDIQFLSSLSANVNDFNIIAVGGGGGGGGSSNQQAGNPKHSTGGGGGGGAAARNNTGVGTGLYNITIGVGGGGGPGNLSGINGTDSSFKQGATNIITCGGGGRGAGHFEGVLGGASGSVFASTGTIYQGDGGNGGSGTEDDNINPRVASNVTNGIQFVLPNVTSLYYSGGGGGGGGQLDVSGNGGGAGNGIGGVVGASSIITGQTATKNGGGGGGGGMNTNGGASFGGQGGSGIVIIYFKYITKYETVFTGPTRNCYQEDNRKVINSSSDVDQTQTQTQRAVNAIKYSSGGRIIFGNRNLNSTGMSFLGRTEGQPGGIIGPLRNKF